MGLSQRDLSGQSKAAKWDRIQVEQPSGACLAGKETAILMIQTRLLFLVHLQMEYKWNEGVMERETWVEREVVAQNQVSGRGAQSNQYEELE